MMDYGAPVGFRLAAKHPERVESLIIQNGNAYDEGLLDIWVPIKAYWADKTDENANVLRDNVLTVEAKKWQYTMAYATLRLLTRLTGYTTSL